MQHPTSHNSELSLTQTLGHRQLASLVHHYDTDTHGSVGAWDNWCLMNSAVWKDQGLSVPRLGPGPILLCAISSKEALRTMIYLSTQTSESAFSWKEHQNQPRLSLTCTSFTTGVESDFKWRALPWVCALTRTASTLWVTIPRQASSPQISIA